MPPPRVPLVAGNWKMNTTVPEGIEKAHQLVAGARPDGVEVAVLPPFTHLWPLRGILHEGGIRLGAQDVFWEDAGAYTGEVSPLSLSGWCDYVLVGHSERRHLFGETDEQVHRKLVRSLTHDLQVIVAVGETLDEREAEATLDVVHRQLDVAFAGVAAETMSRCVVAYEPVWAIGTGRTATPQQAEEVCAAIRLRLEALFTAPVAKATRILYGGSVTADNAAELFAQRDIDGGLVGGVSLKPAEFLQVVAAAAPRGVAS
ncbi:MAG TPA: triose-phosphate isomerase [Candidatus Dormibacteraeota bacterium]|jgi:triosephosphate isomerase|nr:triose-phosphate isomerase [Candidatus Dormibacteraeota bacterium]